LAPEIYYPEGPLAIRDGTHTRLQDIVGVKHVFKTRTLPTKDDQLPIICVAHGGENGRADGDANVGSPHFLNDLKLLITVVDLATSDLALDAGITRKVEEIKQTLFTDSSWLELFEALESFSVTYHFPREAEVVLCEARIELTVTYRSNWPPVALKTLNQIVTTIRLSETSDPIVMVNDFNTPSGPILDLTDPDNVELFPGAL
jgi:hypothetical protein